MSIGKLTVALNEYWKSKTVATSRSYRESLNEFGRFVGLPIVEAIDDLISLKRELAELKAYEFKNWMTARKSKPATIRLRLSALRGCIRELNAAGLCGFTLSIQADKNVLRPERKENTDEDFATLLKTAQSLPSKTKAAQATLLLCLMALEGLRRSTIVDLNFADVSLTHRQIRVKKGSGTQLRHISDETYAALLRWEKCRGSQAGPLFPGKDSAGRRCGNALWNSVTRICRKCNIDANPNSLRQMIVTRKTVDAGCDVRLVAKSLKQQKLFPVKLFQDRS